MRWVLENGIATSFALQFSTERTSILLSSWSQRFDLCIQDSSVVAPAPRAYAQVLVGRDQARLGSH